MQSIALSMLHIGSGPVGIQTYRQEYNDLDK